MAELVGVLRLDRVASRQVAWALIGIRWLPAEIHIPDAAWCALDALALDLYQHRLAPADVSLDLARQAAEAVGGDWPHSSVTMPRRGSRCCAFLDVPALWGVQAVRRAAIRHCLAERRPQRRKRLDRVTITGRDLESALYHLTTATSPTGRMPTERRIETLWLRFEAAVSAAYGTILVLPRIIVPTPETPPRREAPVLRLVPDDG